MKRTAKSDSGTLGDAKVRFTEHFQRALKSCMKRNFSVEVCFGEIWQETLEEIELTDKEQAELYSDLLKWAKKWQK